IPASSSKPWTVPSSPCGPCNMISTASRLVRRPGGSPSELSIRASPPPASTEVARSTSSRLVAASALCGPRASRAASSPSARSGSPPTSQRPSLAMPMGNTSNRERSMAARTEAALARDTSCSPDRPPKTIPTRSFWLMTLLYQTSERRQPFLRCSPAPVSVSPLPPLLQTKRDLVLGAAVRRPVVDPTAQRVRQMLLAHERIRRVVRVLVSLPVPEIGHEARGRIADVQRHGLRGLLLNVLLHRVPRRVDGVRLRGQREVADRLRQRQLAFRRAEKVVGVLRVERQPERHGIRIADVLRSEAYEPARDVERLLAGLQ